MGSGETSEARAASEQFGGVRVKLEFVQREPGEGPTYPSAERFGSLPLVDHEVDILNARPILRTLSLDREGFTLIDHRSEHLNDRDPALTIDEYVDEMNAFVRRHFNASWVTNFRHGYSPPAIVRSPAGAFGGEGTQPVARLAHVDYTAVSLPLVAAISDYEQGFKSRAFSRMMLIQTWRAVSPAPQDFPLTLCDGSSVAETDLVNATYSRDGRDHKLWLVHYNPRQRWYYFPDLNKDELILFKGYDSESKFDPKVLHTGFDNRVARPSANPRMSIETRHLAYFE